MELEALLKARHAAYQAAKGIDFKPGRATKTWRAANRRYALAKMSLKYPKIEVQRPPAATQPAGQPETTQSPKVVSISGYPKAA